jgi:phage replication initiation protein
MSSSIDAQRPAQKTRHEDSPARAMRARVKPSDATPRPVTRGERKKTSALIDWVSFTVAASDEVGMYSIIEELRRLISPAQLIASDTGRGIAGFSNSASLLIWNVQTTVIVGRIAWGGESQRGRIYVSLAGTFCARVNDWEKFSQRLESWAVRLTRVDLAHDDIEGKQPIESVEGIYRAGGFNSGGRMPVCELAGDWLNSSGKGRTFYVGRRAHGKFLRIYEKGKQLGDPNSPWVRWEVELHARDRTIPYDVLTNTASYLAGSYPALEFVSDDQCRIKTQRKVARTTLERLTEVASICSGKTVNAMRMQGLDADEILSLICRPGLPARLAPAEAALLEGTQYLVRDDGDA